MPDLIATSSNDVELIYRFLSASAERIARHGSEEGILDVKHASDTVSWMRSIAGRIKSDGSI